MLIFWPIRYLDRNDRRFKDRDLFLDTDTLPLATKAAVEISVEAKYSRSQRDFLRYKPLLHQQESKEAVTERFQGATQIRGFSLPDYFEDETGQEITLYGDGSDPHWRPGGEVLR